MGQQATAPGLAGGEGLGSATAADAGRGTGQPVVPGSVVEPYTSGSGAAPDTHPAPMADLASGDRASGTTPTALDLSPDCFDLDAARHRYGPQTDAYACFLTVCDPLADDLVASFDALPPGAGYRLFLQALDGGIESVSAPSDALVRLFAQLDHVPYWVDWDRLDRGGNGFLRSGAFGAFVIMLYALPLSYRSPAGNKPLVLSGRMTAQAQAGHRLGETARFVVATSQPGALRRHGEAFTITAKVRVMHAQVRRHLIRSGRWDAKKWGAPINQAYMAGTNLLFSAQLVSGLRRLGFRLTRDEVTSLLHLWRYSGYLSGVDEELLCADEPEAQRLSDIILAVDGVPDEDSCRLLSALLDTCLAGIDEGRRRRAYDAYYGIARSLIGDSVADQFGMPRTAWRYLVPVVRPLVTVWSMAGRSIPAMSRVQGNLGRNGWEQAITVFLGTAPAEFRLPGQ